MPTTSTNISDEPLFSPTPDEQWLTLLDRRFAYGIEVSEPLGGSRSASARTKVFRGHYMMPGGRTRAMCVVKLGERAAIEKDFAGWNSFARTQPNHDAFATMHEPATCDDRGALVVDFVGSADMAVKSLAELARAGSPANAATVRRILTSALGPLHECFRAGDSVPHVRLTRRQAITNWFGKDVVAAVRARVEADASLAAAMQADACIDPHYGFATPNDFRALLTRPTVWGDDRLVALPAGAVHGDPNLDNIFIATAAGWGATPPLALIDFEYCSATAVDSPYDDLAKLECELLLTPPVSPFWQAITYSLLLSSSLVPTRPLACGLPPEHELWDSLVTVRERAGTLARLAGDLDMSEYVDGYLITVLGRALRYLSYDGVVPEARLVAFRICQLLAARLSDRDDKPRFSVPPASKADRATLVPGDRGTVIRAAAGGYAGLFVPDPATLGSYQLTATVTPDSLTPFGWIAIVLGADLSHPYASGLALVLMRRGTEAVALSAVSHDIAVSTRGPLLLLTPEAVVTKLLVFSLVASGENLLLDIPTFADVADGQLPAALPRLSPGAAGFVVHSATATLHRLVVEATDGQRAPAQTSR
jgi:hypothetical protein